MAASEGRPRRRLYEVTGAGVRALDAASIRRASRRPAGSVAAADPL